MNPNQMVEKIKETGVVAIIRGTSSDTLSHIVAALKAGGVRAVEVTLNTPDALEMIKELAKKHGNEILVGAGTVLDAENAGAAILAGAGFILAPNFNIEVGRLCIRYNALYVPGVLTPNEILAAWETGVQLVKIFPAGSLGPRYIKELKGPLPQVEMMPVGGIDVGNAKDFIIAGAAALGVGSELVDKKAVFERRFEIIENKARQFVDAVKAGRAKTPD